MKIGVPIDQINQIVDTYINTFVNLWLSYKLNSGNFTKNEYFRKFYCRFAQILSIYTILFSFRSSYYKEHLLTQIGYKCEHKYGC